MQESLEIVSSIKQKEIDETLHKIEAFHSNIVAKFINKRITSESVTNLSDILLIGSSNNFEQLNNKDKKDDGVDMKKKEEKKFLHSKTKGNFKKLSVLNNSYFQGIFLIIIAGMCLIPCYFLLEENARYTKSIIQIQSFLLGKIIIINYDILQMKCMISELVIWI